MKNVNSKNKFINKIFLIAIIVIFSVQFFIFNNSNEINQNICPIDTLDSINIQQYEDNVQETIYKSEEISIFPEILKISCLNLISDIEIKENKKTIFFYSSDNFYNIFYFFGNFFILIYFLNKKNFRYFLFFLTLFCFLNNYIRFQNEFILGIFLKYLFIYIASIILYFFIGNNLYNLKFFDYFSVLIFLTLFSSYQAFSNLLFLYFLIFFITGDFQNQNNIVRYKNYIKFTPIIFLIYRLITSLSSVFDNYWRALTPDISKSYKRFGDLQLTLNAIKCNFSEFYMVPQYAKFDRNILSCPFETGYPLVDNYINLNIQNIWVSTLFISFVGITIFAIIYLKTLNKDSAYKFFILILFISPPVTFLIERMNIDIFIFIFIWYLINNKKISTYIKSVILFLTTSLKLFTFPIIFSLLLDSLTKKNIKNALVYGFAAGGITAFTYYYFVIVGNFGYKSTYWNENFFVETFSNPSISFGLLTNYVYIEGKFLINGIIGIIILGFAYLIIFTIFTKENFQKYIEVNIESIGNKNEVILIPMLLLLLLYRNIDYRITFFILIFSIILNTNNQLLIISYFLFITTSATNFFLLNDLVIFLNLSAQILIFIFLTYFYLLILTKKRKVDKH